MKSSTRHRMLSPLIQIVSILVWLSLLLGGLHLGTASKHIPFPSPGDILSSFGSLSSLVVDGQVSALAAFFVSLKRILVAILVSGGLGFLVAVVLAWNRNLWDFVQPMFDFLRSIPVTFFVPAAALLVGSSAGGLPCSLAVLPCTLVVVLNMRSALGKISEDKRYVFQALCGTKSRLAQFRYLVLPSLFADWLTGLRFAASYAIVIVSVLEYGSVGTKNPGFGYVIFRASDSQSANPAVYAAIICFGVLGFGINKVCELFGPNDGE